MTTLSAGQRHRLGAIGPASRRLDALVDVAREGRGGDAWPEVTLRGAVGQWVTTLAGRRTITPVMSISDRQLVDRLRPARFRHSRGAEIRTRPGQMVGVAESRRMPMDTGIHGDSQRAKTMW